MGRAACIFAAWWTDWNRKPLTILLFTPLCLAFILAGALAGQGSLALLIVTTALSIDSSLSARMVMLTQAQASGEEPTAVESK